MVPEDIAKALEGLRLRRPDVRLDVRWLPSVTSTMDVASRLAAEGAAPGLVVVADEQTSGRGRRGHVWQSPPGAGLYFSMVCRPSTWTTALSLVTLAAGVAVREGIESATGLATHLKWPNDVLVGRQKLAGILAEGFSLGTSQQSVIVGVGINVQPAAHPPDVAARAGSLEGELGRTVDRAAVLAGVLCALTDRLRSVERDPDGILQAWRAAAPSAVGTRVEWDGPVGLQQGVTAGIDETGGLLIRTAAGVERIIAGEIRWAI
jgi:BirA family biotin operon repressor/biotin-[acetyl-CoA-carboxylase] ligase